MLATLSLILATQVFIPETSERTLEVVPLQRGEVTYIGDYTHEQNKEQDMGKKGRLAKKGPSAVPVNNTAILKIGGTDSRPIDVIDQTGLHGYQVRKLERKDYSIIHDADVTYSAASDSWSAGTVVGHSYKVYITLPDNTAIMNVKYGSTDRTQNPGGMGDVPTGTISNKVEKNTCIIYLDRSCAPGPGGTKFDGPLNVREIEVTVLDFGDPWGINDLTKITFQMKDREGTFRLNDLRNELYHKYDGNRGVDWSKYKAVMPVMMCDNFLTFGASNINDKGLATISYGTTGEKKLTTIVEQNIMTEVYMGGTPYVPNGHEDLRFTAIVGPNSSSGGAATLSFVATGITNFDIKNLHIHYSASLEKNKALWHEVAYTLELQNGVYTARVDSNEEKAGFWRLTYDTREAVFHVRGITKTRRLQLLGTDNVWYEITVDANGLHTAPAVDL